MARFLMLPLAPRGMLAHVGACSAVGDRLRHAGHEVVFGYGGSIPEVLDRQGFEWHALSEVDDADATTWFDTPDDLRRIVAERAELIGRVRPDVCVTSSGVGGMACEVTGVPDLALMHYLPLTRFGRRPGIWRKRWNDLRRPARAWRVLRARVKADSKARLWEIVREVRRDLGLPPTDFGAGGVVVHAPVVACTTTPRLDPAVGLPPNWRYVGPIVWSAPPSAAEEPLPSRGNRPLVYVTQGSTGTAEILRRTVAELAAEPIDVVASTGGLCDPAELRALAPNVTAAELVSGADALEAADAAVIHGGHMTSCEAILAGKPVVVLPRMGDQILWLKRVERLGTGLGRWPRVPSGSIRRDVRRVLSEPRFARRSAELAAELRRDWDGAQNAARAAEELAAGEALEESRATSSSAAAGAAPSSAGIRQR